MVRVDDLGDDEICEQVAARGRSLRTGDGKVAAALFLQNYVYRIAAPALGMWVLHGRIPDLSASNVLVRFGEDGRPADVAMISPSVFVRPGDEVADARCIPVEDLTAAAVATLLEQHLLAFQDRVARLFVLGTLLAKGQVSSQLGLAFTAIDANTPVAWPHVASAAMDLLLRSRDRIEGEGRAGHMILMRLRDGEGVTFRRRICCLVYKAPDRACCGGCPLRDDGDRARIYTERLMSRRPECRRPAEPSLAADDPRSAVAGASLASTE